MTQSQGVITPNASRAPNTTQVVKIILAVAGAIVGLATIGLFIGGIALITVHATQRDDDGFLTSPDFDMETSTYALVSEDIDLGSFPDNWWPSDSGTVRVNADPDGTRSVFLGIGPADDVDQFLSGVAFDEVTGLGSNRSDVDYRTYSGGAPTSPPGAQDFWVAASQGRGPQELEWELESGEWKLLLMNADGSSGLRAEVEAGAKIGILLPIGIGLMVAAFFSLIVTVTLLVVAVRIGRKNNRPIPGTARASDAR